MKTKKLEKVTTTLKDRIGHLLRMFEYMLQSRESSWGFPSTL